MDFLFLIINLYIWSLNGRCWYLGKENNRIQFQLNEDPEKEFSQNKKRERERGCRIPTAFTAWGTSHAALAQCLVCACLWYDHSYKMCNLEWYHPQRKCRKKKKKKKKQIVYQPKKLNLMVCSSLPRSPWLIHPLFPH